MKRTIAFACMTGLVVAALSAQDQTSADRRKVEIAAATGALRVALETRVTRGKPYSADAVTEFVQVLGDGNRIVRRNSSRVFRDAEGRTRREELGDNGSPQPKNGVTITDPVAGTSFVLDAMTRTAFKSPGMFAKMEGGNFTIARASGGGARGGGVPAEAKVEVITIDPEVRQSVETKIAVEAGARGGAMVGGMSSGRGGVFMTSPGLGESSKEDLPEQNIEGVSATGSRTTTVIPAGALGNEQPITIVSEQWFSTDLDALVLTRHSDPRVGETTYRLLNVSRAEPDRSLFQVPSDYTVQDRTPMLRRQQQD